jgi:hypothetical protein
MWSHYSKHHQGFCIEYDFGNCNEITEKLYPVVYNEKRPVVLPDDLTLNKKSCIRTILCKSPVWAYEYEWRYLHVMNPKMLHKTEKTNISAPNAIKAIYLGVEANEIQHKPCPVTKLHNLAYNFNIPLYKMRFDDNEYKLIPERIAMTRLNII